MKILSDCILPKIAWKKIPAYKVIVRQSSEKIELFKTYTSERKLKWRDILKRDKGFISSYSNRVDANKHLLKLKDSLLLDSLSSPIPNGTNFLYIEIFEGYVPSLSLYYKRGNKIFTQKILYTKKIRETMVF